MAKDFTSTTVGSIEQLSDGSLRVLSGTSPDIYEIVAGRLGAAVVLDKYTSADTFTAYAGTRAALVLAWGSGDAGDPFVEVYNPTELGATAAIAIGDGAGSPTDTTFNPAGTGSTLTATGATGNAGKLYVVSFIGDSVSTTDFFSTLAELTSVDGAADYVMFNDATDGLNKKGLPDNVVLSGLKLTDGVTAPGTVSGVAQIYVDSADGDLKVKFGDGTVTVIAVDT